MTLSSCRPYPAQRRALLGSCTMSKPQAPGRICLIVVGPPGCGKTSITSSACQHIGLTPQGAILASPDQQLTPEMRCELEAALNGLPPEGPFNEGDYYRMDGVFQEVWRRHRPRYPGSMTRLHLAKSLRRPIIREAPADSSASCRSVIAFSREARHFGYRVVMAFPLVPLELLWRRVVARAAREHRTVGGLVHVQRGYAWFGEHVGEIVRFANRVLLFDNSGSKPLLVYSGRASSVKIKALAARICR